MRKMFRKVLTVALATILSLGAFTGCSKPLSETDLALPTYEDNKSLIIDAMMPPDLTNKEMLITYMDAGFTRVCMGEEYLTPTAQESDRFPIAIENCQELGLEIMVLPHRSIVKNGKDEGLADGANWYEKRFGDMDLTQTPITALFITDEPQYIMYEDLENRYLPWFNEKYGGKDMEFICNLFPVRQDPLIAIPEGKTYDDYAERYLEILDQVQSVNKTFSIDYYTLRDDGTKKWMFDTDIMSYVDAATRAEERNIKLGTCIQSFGGIDGKDTYRYPSTYAELSWSVYNSLVYGADRFIYFGYCDLPSFNFKCMVSEGEPNELWHHTKKVNAYVKNFDHVFMSFKWEKLFAQVGSGSRSSTNEAFEIARTKNMLATSLTGISKVENKYDVIISENTDGTNDGFWIMNYDDPMNARTNKTTLTFENADGVLYYRNGEPNTVVLGKDKTFTLDLEAGEGVFAIPVYAKTK